MGGHQAALAQRLALLVHNRIDDSPGALHVAAAGYIRLTQARLESVLEATLPSFEVRLYGSLCSSSLQLPLQLLYGSRFRSTLQIHASDPRLRSNADTPPTLGAAPQRHATDEGRSEGRRRRSGRRGSSERRRRASHCR